MGTPAMQAQFESCYPDLARIGGRNTGGEGSPKSRWLRSNLVAETKLTASIITTAREPMTAARRRIHNLRAADAATVHADIRPQGGSLRAPVAPRKNLDYGHLAASFRCPSLPGSASPASANHHHRSMTNVTRAVAHNCNFSEHPAK